MSRQTCIADICHSSKHNETAIPKSRVTFYTAIFPIYQKLHQNSQITVSQFANEYKDVLITYLHTLNQYYHVQELQKEYRDFTEHLKIWDLCNVLYFNTISSNLSKALMDWYTRHNKIKYNEYQMQEIYNHPKGPMKHANFWKYALRLTVFGRLDQLSRLLQAAASTPSRQQFFTDLLSNLQGSLTHTDQLEQILVILKSPDFKHPAIYKDAIELTEIVSLLLGDESTILSNALDRSHAFILFHYYQPSLNLNSDNVFTKATDFFNKYPHNNPDVCEIFMTGNIYQAFTLCADMDWWLLAHLSDLLELQQKLDRPIEITVDNSIVSLPAREYFVLYYTSFIKNKFDLWHIAFEYMLTCKTFGREVMIEHLKSMDLNKDDKELDNIVKYCIDHDLENNVYETKANECISSKDYKRAIELFKKANLRPAIDNVFRVIIEDFAKTGSMYHLDSLEHYDGLYYTIYHYLWKMHIGYKTRDNLLAVSAFKELISNTDIPNFIIVIILWEGLKLVEDNNMLYFQKSDIIKVQNLWKKLNEARSIDDFILFHHHINKNDTSEPIPVPTLQGDMMVFLDTTGVLFSRALDATTK